MSGITEPANGGHAAPVSESGSDSVSDSGHRSLWLMLGAALGLATGFSGLYFSTLAIFLKPIAAEFGWGRGEASAVVLMSMLGSAAGAPFLGVLIDRIGARRLIVTCSLMLAASICVLSVLPDNRTLFAGICFAIGVLAVGTGPAGYLAVLPAAFDRRLGLALSVAMAGLGAGAAVLPIVAQASVTGGGWRDAYRVLAVIAAIGGVVAFLLMGLARARAQRRVTGEATGPGVSLAEALRDARLWLLIAVIFVCTTGGLGATVHIVALLTDRGIGPTQAASVAALSGVGLMVGRFSAGFLFDIVFAPLVAAAGFVLGAVGLAIIGFDVSAAPIVLAVGGFLFGLALGAEGDFAAFAVRRYFGGRAFGSIYGVVYAAYALGGVAGPILFGIGFDRLGDYRLVLGLATVAYLASGAALFALGPYRYRKAAPAHA